MQSKIIDNLFALVVLFALSAPPNMAAGQSDSAITNPKTDDKITIVDSNGNPAEKAIVVSVSKKMSRGRLLNATADGGFSPHLIDETGQPLPGVERADQAIPGATMMLADANGVANKPADAIAFLVVSQDQNEVAFVPPEYEGTVRLRPCGKLKFDLSDSNSSGEPCTVVVVWKNSLAGNYALNGTKQPGDPVGDVNMDWRLNAFFQVTTILKIDPSSSELPEIYLPPGEVSVAAISNKQLKLLSEFQTDFEQNRNNYLTFLPATCGIYRVVQSKTTTVPLRMGTCFKGKIISNSNSAEMPDWQDSGFADGYISISDNWTTRLDRIPDYDLAKGVNHYFRVLQSETGMNVRARTLTGSQAFLKSDGAFVTKPLPKGEYGAFLYRPSQTVERPMYSPNGQTKKTRMRVGAALRSAADLPNPLAELNGKLLSARKAVWGGDLETASQQVESAKLLLASPGESKELAASIHDSVAEIEQMIHRRSQLIEMYRENDKNYNSQAAAFLLSQAEGFLKQSDFFSAESAVSHARRFTSDTNRHDELQAKIETARAKSLSEPNRVYKYQDPFQVNDHFPEIVDVGKLIFDVPKSTGSFVETNDSYNPLQTLPVTDPAVFRRLQALVFRERAAAERVLKEDPQEAIKQLVQVRKIIQESAVPHNSRTPLLEVIDHDIKQTQDHIEKNFAEIDRNSSTSQQVIQQIKAISDHDSLQFKSAVDQLRSTISEQFDEKLRERDAELELLEEKISKARQRLKQREANRTEIIERRLRKLLFNDGIEAGKLPD